MCEADGTVAWPQNFICDARLLFVGIPHDSAMTCDPAIMCEGKNVPAHGNVCIWRLTFTSMS